MSLQTKAWCVLIAFPSLDTHSSRPMQKLRLPLQRRSSTISYTSTDMTSTLARRSSIALHPLSAARYAFNRSVRSFRSWSTSSWRRSSASIDDLPSPPTPVSMTVDDYGSMLFYDIDDLVPKAGQHAFNTLTQKLHPRHILHVGELDDFFTERENLEIEARLFDGSESEGMASEENPRAPIKSYDVEDSLGSSIMLYAGIRQCGGVAQRARGRVAHDHWSTRDEVLMQSNRDALRAAFLADRAAAKEAPKAEVRELVEELVEEPMGEMKEPVEELVVGGPAEEPVEEMTQT